MNSGLPIVEWVTRARTVEEEANRIFARYEHSRARVVVLNVLLKRLELLPIDVRDYFSEAVQCLELNLLRSASVMSWAGFFQVFAEKLFEDHENDIRSIRLKWAFKDLTELKENISESQILDVAKDLKFINKARLRVLQGHLATRNQCAHPTLYKPSLNSCIGYVDEMISSTEKYL